MTNDNAPRRITRFVFLRGTKGVTLPLALGESEAMTNLEWAYQYIQL